MAILTLKTPVSHSSEPRPLRFAGDDRALVRGLKQGHPGAMEALYDRYAAHVERVLTRVLGFDPERYDLVHEVFIEAYRSARRIKDGQALQAWMTTLTVFTARQCIRKRQRRRVYWVKDAAPHMEVPVFDADPAEIEVLRAAYRVLDGMSAEDRILFSLRFIDGMELAELAAACNVSLSTVKRRLRRAEARFSTAAERFPSLAEYAADGGRRRNR